LIVPGGHVEFGETLNAALVREIKEETGMEVINPEFIGVDEMINKDRHFVFINYICRYCCGEIVLNNEGIDGHFYDLEDALAERLATPTRRLLEMAKICIGKRLDRL